MLKRCYYTVIHDNPPKRRQGFCPYIPEHLYMGLSKKEALARARKAAKKGGAGIVSWSCHYPSGSTSTEAAFDCKKVGQDVRCRADSMEKDRRRARKRS